MLFRNENGEAEFAFQLTKFLKGKLRPGDRSQLDVHEHGYSPVMPLYLNPMLFLLVIFCSTGALRDFKGQEGLRRLLELDVPPNEPCIIIDWDPKALCKPVFTNSKGQLLTGASMSSYLRPMLIRAGFPDPPQMQDFRAEGLTRIGNLP